MLVLDQRIIFYIPVINPEQIILLFLPVDKDWFLSKFWKNLLNTLRFVFRVVQLSSSRHHVAFPWHQGFIVRFLTVPLAIAFQVVIVDVDVVVCFSFCFSLELYSLYLFISRNLINTIWTDGGKGHYRWWKTAGNWLLLKPQTSDYWETWPSVSFPVPTLKAKTINPTASTCILLQKKESLHITKAKESTT